MKLTNKSTFRTLLLAGCIAVVSSCKMTDLDINTDPNKPATGSLALLLPKALDAAVDARDFSLPGWTGVYNSNDDFSVTNSSFNLNWNLFYNSTQNIEEMIKTASDGKNPRYLGIAYVLKAYAVGNFVDSFGDIPYSEAWKGNVAGGSLTPKFDKDSEIYEKLIKMCDDAVAELAKAQPVAVSGDYLYAGNAASWTRLAKTVKLRLLLNARKGRATGNADLAKAFADGGYITTPAQDWTNQFSTVLSPVDNRHPWFRNSWWGTSGDFNYLSHQMMGEMLLNKDPRLNYYFFRQTSTVLDPSNPDQRGTIPFGNTYLVERPAFLAEYKKAFNITGDIPKADIAYLAGFFGRDRGDVSGVPADGSIRMMPGVYPCGGKYQDKSMAARTLTGGNSGGNGVWPMITSWNVKFYQVEAILDGTGTTGDAKALFEAAMREHIGYVETVSRRADAAAPAMSKAEIDAYVKAWVDLYLAAPSNQAKLNVVAKQIYFCSFGQNQDLWNLMRRTGFPVQGPFRAFSTGIMAPVMKPKRQFALRLPYPVSEGNLNPNAKTMIDNVIFDRDPVFWDKVKIKWEF